MAVAFLKDDSWVGGVGGFFFWGLCKLQVGLSRWGWGCVLGVCFWVVSTACWEVGGFCYRFVGTGMEVGGLLFHSD